MSSSIDWDGVIKKEARGSNDEDLGEVQEVTEEYVLVKKGMINKKKFYIPRNQAKSYDGDVLRFKLTEDEIANQYAGDSPPEISSSNSEDERFQEEGEEEGRKGTEAAQTEETTVPLTEEKMDVSKNVQESQATITKEPITETKTIEVPVKHEEIEIEIRPASGQTEAKEPISSKEDITIPLKKEEVEVSKKAQVKEEVTIKKKPVTETRQVSEEVTSERINTSDME